MRYKFSVWQVYYNNNLLVGTYETRQLALKRASEINERNIRLCYVAEVKVYGGKVND
ncbi:hypothetical protein GTN30_06370 [Macrococcoides canis]|uniref:Uncharacterized protein n=1 Tax=Macrococcoides canis TaxID=1855823 RepID=A0AAE6X2E1_9STAP|nr:hypothetical protein [Macrococcus canis]QIH78292.1 hypothetical protein GTN30_06370 [Macrococcus canis]